MKTNYCLLISFFVLLLTSCNKPKVKSEIFYANNFYVGVHVQFVNSKIAYGFGNGEFEDNPKIKHYINNRTSYAIIYKSVDGGLSWKEIYRIKDFSFYSTVCEHDNMLYIKLIDMSFTNKYMSSKVVAIDYKKETYKMLNYTFDRMGNIWYSKNRLFVDCNQYDKNKIISFDIYLNNLDSIDRKMPLFYNDVCKIGDNNYVLTHSNQLYLIEDRISINLTNKKYEQLARANDHELLLFSQDKEDDAKKVYIEKYNVKTKTITPVCEYNGYTIIEKFKANDKVIVGFIGNIKGIFTAYDMIYSLDHGNTWNKYRLDD
ncbi:MAG: hypothetical protein RIS29_1778, partial [Bacteroidota bacterium]